MPSSPSDSSPQALLAPKARAILPALRAELDRLDTIPDVIAVGHLKTLYHLAAHYGLQELRPELRLAATRLFHRYDKTDPVKLHHYLATTVHCLCELEWMPILERAVNNLGLPPSSQNLFHLLKANVQDYHANQRA